MNDKSFIYFWLLLTAAIGVYLIGLSIDVMDIDAAQYASIALEMVHKNSFLTITNRNVDYLDKPPLAFWLSALSYILFGVSTVTYKLPSLLFTFLTFFSTYKLARLFYTKEIALLSVVITATCQAFFMINNDCRTDTILTGAITFSLYQLLYYINTKHYGYFIGSFIGISLAMLSKGPIGFVLPVCIVTLDLMVKKQWGEIFSPKWLWGALIIFIMLLPMCIGLYQQFGAKGLQFYFWDQSFGRLTGQNSFVKSLSAEDYIDDPFFFYHTFIWAFAPWSFLFVTGLFYEVKGFILQKAKLLPHQETITWVGFIFIFFIMSMSMYKLPHYIVLVFPLASIVTAKFIILHLKGKLYTWFTHIHVGLMIGLWGIGFYLVGISFSNNNTLSLLLGVLFLLLTFLVFIKTTGIKKLICLLSLTIIFGNFFLNYHVYPRLLTYQSGSIMGRYIYDQQIKAQNIYNFTCTDHSLDFYAQKIIPRYEWNTIECNKALQSGNYIIANKEALMEIEDRDIAYKVLLFTDHYNVTLLTVDFLNPLTRSKVLQQRLFIKIL